MKCRIKKKATKVLGRQTACTYGSNADQGQPNDDVDAKSANTEEEITATIAHIQQQESVMQQIQQQNQFATAEGEHGNTRRHMDTQRGT